MTSTCENPKTKNMEIFQFYENSGLLVLYIYLHFSSVIKKIHSETLLCFHSAHQESLNRRRSHSSRPIPWDILNILMKYSDQTVLKIFFKLFIYYESFLFIELNIHFPKMII